MAKAKTKHKKKRNHGAKGGIFEREICVLLSKWWSKGKSEDLFWRTAGSGARATVRGRKGKTTTGHCGDICSTDPKSKPLMDVVSIELKRGYTADNIHALLDKPKKIKQQTWEGWIEKAICSQENANAFAWIIIARRDRREALIFMPDYLEEHLVRLGVSLPTCPYVRFRTSVRLSHKKQIMTVVGTRLDKWLKSVDSDTILRLSKEV